MRRRRLTIWVAVAGLATGCATDAPLWPAWVLVAGATLAGIVLLRARYGLRPLVASFCLALALGRLAAADDSGPIEALARDAPSCALEGRILERVGSWGTLLAIDRLDCDKAGAPSVTGAVVVPGALGIPGGEWIGEGRLLPLAADRAGRMARRAGATVQVIAGTFHARPPHLGHMAVAEAFRRSIAHATQGLSEVRAGLLRGLTIGDTAALPGSVTENFRRSGLAHVLAVSGSNVGIILGGVIWASRRLSAQARTFLSAGALALFVLVVGPDPSVLRATAMGALLVLATWKGERLDTVAALGVALLILLALRPLLIFSVGLHLSAAATAGIVLWTEPLVRRLHMVPRPLALLLAVSIAAQAAVAPILVLVFGELSLVSPLANLLALPVVAPLTIVGFLAGALDVVWPTAARAIVWAASPLASWTLGVASTTSALPAASVAVPSWTGGVLAVAVALAAGHRAFWHTERPEVRNLSA